MPAERIEVSVVLPCYNEEKALPQVIRDIQDVMNTTPYAWEFLIVDDKSTDASARIGEQLGCKVIRHLQQKGAGAARKTGILKAQGEIIVMLDADGTYTASDLPELLKHFPQYDQVNGARTSEQGSWRWLRASAKWCIRSLASLLVGQRIPDLNTGLKAFKRSVMLQYLWAIPDGFSCVSSMTLAYLCNGHHVQYIPTQYHKRIGSSKFHPLKDTYSSLLTVLRLIIYFKPLRIFLPLGGIFMLAAMGGSNIYLFAFGILIISLGWISQWAVTQIKSRKRIVLD